MVVCGRENQTMDIEQTVIVHLREKQRGELGWSAYGALWADVVEELGIFSVSGEQQSGTL